jgi:hypothetical protein
MHARATRLLLFEPGILMVVGQNAPPLPLTDPLLRPGLYPLTEGSAERESLIEGSSIPCAGIGRRKPKQQQRKGVALKENLHA